MSLPIQCEEIKTPFIISHSSYFVLTIILLLVAAVTICFFPVERRVAMRGKCIDVPVNTPLFFTSDSYLIHWFVHEGEYVNKGQRLLQYQPIKSISDDMLIKHSQFEKIYKSIKKNVQMLIEYTQHTDSSFHAETYRRLDELMKQMLTIKNQDHTFNHFYLNAPINGVITKIRTVEGNFISIKKEIAEIEPANQQRLFETIIPDFYYKYIDNDENKLISLRIHSRHCHPCKVHSKFMKIEQSFSRDSTSGVTGHYALLRWPEELQQEQFSFELILGYTTLWESIWYSNDNYL